MIVTSDLNLEGFHLVPFNPLIYYLQYADTYTDTGLLSSCQQVAVVVTEPDSEQVEDISTPPTEPQVEPIETAEPWAQRTELTVVSCQSQETAECQQGSIFCMLCWKINVNV